VKVPVTWRPTGWFMIGWGADFEPGRSKPLKYFGHDLVAYRTDDGDLHVLDAHCPHLGAHLGHGGKVVGECVTCPYHGWSWGPDGTNRAIPYEDRPNPSKRLRVWPITELHECVFLWHDPAGGPPRWEVPDLFDLHVPADPADFYRAYPELSIKFDGEPVHPQIPLENGPDTVHFKYVHHASVDPVLVDWKIEGHEWRHTAGWPNPRGEGLALRLHSILAGVGGSFVVFEGAENYRLVFHTTPVDDSTSDMFYSIWWPRDVGDTSMIAPDAIRDHVTNEFISTLEDDLEIWRYQVYIEHPAFAQQDARPYGAIRKWARQFYEIDIDAVDGAP
jgi:3-ketosteroid 9alpha-monooxygenase subunit A